ncbi:MAG: aldo/keto reductase, partial [Microbacterium sp.]
TLPEAAVAYVLRHPAVVSVVLGARGRSQVEQNLARAQQPVPDALWHELAEGGLIPKENA